MCTPPRWGRLRRRTACVLALLFVAGFLGWGAGARANSSLEESTAYVPPVCEIGGAPATVFIDGGTVSNTTVLDLSADGGTAIGDSSGGDDNLAIANERDTDGNYRDRDSRNKKTRNDKYSEVAAAGNGGVSGADANGGAIAVENVNSGGNVGSAIAVGDTIDAGYDGCGNAVGGVFIDGGEVSNATIISLSADGGTAIADASGGDGNIAFAGGRTGNGGTITNSAGNGGVANASANGGVISLGDINSGGNAGNAIGVGDSVAGPVPVCCAPPPFKPIPIYPGKPAPAPGKVTPGKVVIVTALPDTGSGTEAISGTVFGVALMALSSGVASLASRRRDAPRVLPIRPV